MRKLLSKIKGHFRKPELEFNQPLTSADVVRMVKTKQFNGLKKLMPQFNWGGKRLSRSKSALAILGFVVGIGLFSLTGNPLPLFLSILSIGYGSEYVFNAANTLEISASSLDSTHFVVVYKDDGGADYGCAKVGTISGTTISFGSEYIFNSANTVNISVSAINSTHFVVAYKDYGGDGYGHCKFGTVSSVDEIAYGAEATFNSADSYTMSTDSLDSTHFVVAGGNSSYGTAYVGTISGTSITFGSEYTFNSAITINISISSIDATHFVVAYKDYGGDGYGHCKVGTVSSVNQIAYGSEYPFNSASTSYISVSSLDSTHFVVAYRDGGDSNYGKAIVGTVSSVNEIAYGNEYPFNSASTNYLSVSSLDSTHFVVAYRDGGDSNYGKAIVGTVSSVNEIAYGSDTEFNAGSTYYSSITALDATHFVVAYKDTGNLNKGTAIHGTYTSPVVGPANVKSWNGVAIANIKSINGVAIASVKSVNGVEQNVLT